MAAAKAAKEDVFDEDRLCRLVEMMKEHDLSEIDLEEDTQRIRLRATPHHRLASRPFTLLRPQTRRQSKLLLLLRQVPPTTRMLWSSRVRWWVLSIRSQIPNRRRS